MVRNRRTLAAVTLAPMVVFGLAACGGGSSTGTTGSPGALPVGTATAGGPTGASTSAPTATSGPGTGAGGRNGAQFQKIQQCLSAAGITLPTRAAGDGARPSDGTRPTDLPSGMPGGGPRPSGSFGPGGRAGGGGGFGRMFQDKNVQAALKACGLTVPTGRPSATATR